MFYPHFIKRKKELEFYVSELNIEAIEKYGDIIWCFFLHFLYEKPFHFHLCYTAMVKWNGTLTISTIEMRLFWMDIKYIKSAFRLLDKDCVNKRGLYLLKEVLWVSVGQRAAELPAIKVGGKKNSAKGPSAGAVGSNRATRQNCFYLYLWWLAALQPFDLQRPTVPL